MSAAGKRLGRIAIKTLLVILAISKSAYGGQSVERTPADEVAIGGFVYQAPDSAWQAKLNPPNELGIILHEYRQNGSRIQLSVYWIKPRTYVLHDQASLLDYTERAWGRDGHTVVDTGRGATCTRWARRWNQTISLNDSPPKVTATFADCGLICIDPSTPDHIIHVRVTEHLPPNGEISPDYAELAEKVLGGVRLRAP